jgi:hypothetical protein
MTTVLLSRLGEHPLVQQLTTGIAEFEWIAGENLSANRVLMLSPGDAAIYCDPTILDYPVILGVSITAANQGDLVRVRRSGFMEDGNWTFQPRYPIWSGVDGALAQIAPSQGWLVQVGQSLTSTKIQLEVVNEVTQT